MSNVVMIPNVFDRKSFESVIRAPNDEDAGALAATHMEYFRECFSPIDAPRLDKPGPAKTKPPPVPIDKAALSVLVRAYIERHPRSKAEEVAANLPTGGVEPQRLARAVRDALESLVDSKALCCDGERRGRKYYPPSKVNGAAEATE